MMKMMMMEVVLMMMMVRSDDVDDKGGGGLSERNVQYCLFPGKLFSIFLWGALILMMI